MKEQLKTYYNRALEYIDDVELTPFQWIKIFLAIILAGCTIFFALQMSSAYSNEKPANAIFSFFLFAFSGTLFLWIFLPSIVTFVADVITRGTYSADVNVEFSNDFSVVKAMVSQNRYEEAISELKGIITNDPTNWKAKHEMAKIQDHHMEQFGEAVESYQHTLQMINNLKPEGVDETMIFFIINRIAELKQQELGDPEGARESIKEHLDKIPENSKNYEQLQSKLEELEKIQ